MFLFSILIVQETVNNSNQLDGTEWLDNNFHLHSHNLNSFFRLNYNIHLNFSVLSISNANLQMLHYLHHTYLKIKCRHMFTKINWNTWLDSTLHNVYSIYFSGYQQCYTKWNSILSIKKKEYWRFLSVLCDFFKNSLPSEIWVFKNNGIWSKILWKLLGLENGMLQGKYHFAGVIIKRNFIQTEI